MDVKRHPAFGDLVEAINLMAIRLSHSSFDMARAEARLGSSSGNYEALGQVWRGHSRAVGRRHKALKRLVRALDRERAKAVEMVDLFGLKSLN